MGAQDNFKTFMRAAFAVEPGGRVGRQLEEIYGEVSLARGAMAPLDPASDQLVYLSTGASKLCARGAGSRAQIVAFHFSGDIVSIPASATHIYDLIALEETSLLVFPAREFFDCASHENTMARTLLDRLPASLHRCRDKTVALGCKNALERMATFLVGMAQRVGKTKDNSCVLDLPMSRRDIGDSLGLTIETVSRQLGVLKDAGLIRTSGRTQIIIHDLAALRERAGNAVLPEKKAPSPMKFDLDQSATSGAAITL